MGEADDVGAQSLLLVDLDAALVGAWEEEFAAWPSAVRTAVAGLETVTGVDALMTAGNSYGQMDGGVDRIVATHFPGVQRSVWAAIADQSRGYLPVGSAVVVATGSKVIPWLVYAPTMRVPRPLTGDLETAVHDAFWAALVAVDRHNRSAGAGGRISSVASPGFGTGFGQVPPRRAAQLMATAFRFWRTGATASIFQRESELEG